MNASKQRCTGDSWLTSVPLDGTKLLKGRVWGENENEGIMIYKSPSLDIPRAKLSVADHRSDPENILRENKEGPKSSVTSWPQDREKWRAQLNEFFFLSFAPQPYSSLYSKVNEAW